jgi:nitrate reductase delta subunit
MSDDERLMLKMMSILLTYPDKHYQGALASLKERLEELPSSEVQQKLAATVRRLQQMPPLSLQEEYTRTFDFDPSHCLQLSYLKWGDARERGAELARLRRIYRDAGFEMLNRELPDHLPLMLEFFSIGPEDTGRQLVDNYRNELNGLAQRIVQSPTVYAGVMESLAKLLLS